MVSLIKRLWALFWQHKYSLLYLLLIPLVNWAFGNTPNFTLPDGGKWSPMSVVVGLILVVRDFAQREIGHMILIPLIIGVILSYFMAPPIIAIASSLAFLMSESIDWGIFTFTRAPLSVRVLFSSMVGSVADSVIYLTGAQLAVPGIFSAWTLATMLLSKFSGALVIYYMLYRREKRGAKMQQPIAS
jgi:uncharacterized PurR-regulated membrane protein YhhQ (DUF165 family)